MRDGDKVHLRPAIDISSDCYKVLQSPANKSMTQERHLQKTHRRKMSDVYTHRDNGKSRMVTLPDEELSSDDSDSSNASRLSRSLGSMKRKKGSQVDTSDVIQSKENCHKTSQYLSKESSSVSSSKGNIDQHISDVSEVWQVLASQQTADKYSDISASKIPGLTPAITAISQTDAAKKGRRYQRRRRSKRKAISESQLTNDVAYFENVLESHSDNQASYAAMQIEASSSRDDDKGEGDTRVIVSSADHNQLIDVPHDEDIFRKLSAIGRSITSQDILNHGVPIHEDDLKTLTVGHRLASFVFIICHTYIYMSSCHS